MSIISQISRIEDAANIIKAKTVQLGLDKAANTKVSSGDKLEAHAAAISSIVAQSVSTSKLTGSTTSVTIAKGYYGSDSTISVDTSTISSVELSTAEKVITCANKMMTSNITIPSANGYYTDHSAPDSSFGNNGDLFLVI